MLYARESLANHFCAGAGAPPLVCSGSPVLVTPLLDVAALDASLGLCCGRANPRMWHLGMLSGDTSTACVPRLPEIASRSPWCTQVKLRTILIAWFYEFQSNNLHRREYLRSGDDLLRWVRSILRQRYKYSRGRSRDIDA